MVVSSTQERIKGARVPHNVQPGDLSEDASVLNFFDLVQDDDSFEIFDNMSDSS